MRLDLLPACFRAVCCVCRVSQTACTLRKKTAMGFVFRRLPWLICVLLLSACGATPVATITPTPTVAAPPSATLPPSDASSTAIGIPTTAPPTATSTPGDPAPTVTSTPSDPAPTPSPVPPTAAPPPPSPDPGIAAELLFLRNGTLIALNPATGAERILTDTVSDFAATPDGRRIALVRGSGTAAELWVIERNGNGLEQLTSNNRAESSPSWAPDGLAVAYTSAVDQARSLDWEGWSTWCAAADVRIIDLRDGVEQTLGAGCEPAFAPDGQRIAFATAPTAAPPGFAFPGSTNAIRMVNRAGANGWNYATGGPDTQPMSSYLVYGPAWSPDASQLAYQRFVGYQALIDINMTELGVAFRGPGEPIGIGAGWLLPPRFAPDGRTVAVVQHHFGDPRGFSGYDIWSVTLLRLGATETVTLPAADLTLNATVLATLPRSTAAAWAPDGSALAVILPADWEPGRSPQEPAFPGAGAGAVWRWTPGSDPDLLFAPAVDFGSPLLWLPALQPLRG
jgi:Tol biopolymer transport system component